MEKISRDQLKEKMEQGHVVLVDVLSPDSFESFHLPGAVNVPLGEDFVERIQQVVPDPTTPIAVYCKDMQCQASTKAARLLDEAGHQCVLDYTAGKADWRQAGEPVETAS